MTPSRPFCMLLANTLRTRPLVAGQGLDEEHPLATDDSGTSPAPRGRRHPGYQLLLVFDALLRPGRAERDRAAISTATGSAKRSTGRTQAVSGNPLENHTTISDRDSSATGTSGSR